jgi:hypothetical protein
MPSESAARRAVWLLFLLGLAVQAAFVVRAWRAWPSYARMHGNSIATDVLQFRDLMVPFLKDPRCTASFKKSGAGADVPGCLLPFVLGAPVLATGDVRTAAFVVVAFHVAGGLILVSAVRSALGEAALAVYLVVFWLSPWRLFHSGFIWEPNLLILPAATHLWSCWRLRVSPRTWPSLVLGATLAATPQLHFSGIVLVLLTGILLVRGRLRIAWAAFLAGAAAGFMPLAPALVAWAHGTPPTLSAGSGYLGRGFLLVLPVLRALLFWLRLGSVDGGRMHAADCIACVEAAMGSGTLAVFRCALFRAVGALAFCSVGLVLWGAIWTLRRRDDEGVPDGERWAGTYAWSALGALLLAAGIAPITLQTWHVFIAAPAACLPVALFIARRWPFRGGWRRALVAAFLIARLPIAALILLEYPAFCLVPDAVAERVHR